MANEYRVAESTNLIGSRCFSMQYSTALQNGAIVGKGDLVTDEVSIYNAIDDTTDGEYLVLNPAWSYDDYRVTDQNEENYINAADKPFRVYKLKKDNKFKIYNITESFEVGDYVSYDISSDAWASADSSNFKVVAVEEVGFPYCVGSAGVQLEDDTDNEYGYTSSTRMTKYTIEKVA